eukprot:scaffold326996_cov67-Tisochrysis_lutea.AAC.3
MSASVACAAGRHTRRAAALDEECDAWCRGARGASHSVVRVGRVHLLAHLERVGRRAGAPSLLSARGGDGHLHLPWRRAA